MDPDGRWDAGSPGQVGVWQPPLLEALSAAGRWGGEGPEQGGWVAGGISLSTRAVWCTPVLRALVQSLKRLQGMWRPYTVFTVNTGKASGCSASASRLVSDPSPTGPEAKPSGPVLSPQDLLRPRPLPQVPARGLLPVPGLPDRAARGGGRAAAQRPGARARGGPAPDPSLRGRPRRLY